MMVKNSPILVDIVEAVCSRDKVLTTVTLNDKYKLLKNISDDFINITQTHCIIQVILW